MWVRYRVGSSSSKGEWEWEDLGGDFGGLEPEQKKAVIEELQRRIDDRHDWSEHYRGVTIDRPVALPPRWVLLEHVEDAAAAFRAQEERVRRLDEQLADCPPCRTCGRHDAAAKHRREVDQRYDFGQCYRCGKPLAIPPALAKTWAEYRKRKPK